MSGDNKWEHIHSMWGGLGLFLILALWAVLVFLSGGREAHLQHDKIQACTHAKDVAACVKSVH